jgi:hypothetical protein
VDEAAACGRTGQEAAACAGALLLDDAADDPELELAEDEAEPEEEGEEDSDDEEEDSDDEEDAALAPGLRSERLSVR